MSLTDEEREIGVAFGVLQQLKDLLRDQGITLEIQDERTIVANALTRHGEHLEKHNVQPTATDPFKLACWLVGCMIERLGDTEDDDGQKQIVLDALLRQLVELFDLEVDGKIQIPSETKQLLKNLLIQEHTLDGDERHGIGMNGIYVAFHCLLVGFRSGESAM